MEVDAINYLKYLYPEDLYVTDVPEDTCMPAKVISNEENLQHKAKVEIEIDHPKPDVSHQEAPAKHEVQTEQLQEKTKESLAMPSTSEIEITGTEEGTETQKSYDLIVILPETHKHQQGTPENELLNKIIAAIHIKADRWLRLHDGLKDEYIKQRLDESQCKICITFGARSIKNIPKTTDFYQIIEINDVKFIHSASLESLNLYIDEKRKLWTTLQTII